MNKIILDIEQKRMFPEPGNLFISTQPLHKGDVFILANCGLNTYALVSLEDGKTWLSPSSFKDLDLSEFVQVENAIITISQNG